MKRSAAVAAFAAAVAACRCAPPPPPPAPKQVRAPAAAGQFYPGDAATLAAAVRGHFSRAARVVERPARIVLAPHAGLVYSGDVAAAAIRQLEPGFERAVVIAANHDGQSWFEGFSVDGATHYAVPGLEVPVAAAARELARRPGAAASPGAHGTHVVEIHLPFLREANGGRPFELVPVIVGQLDYAGAVAVAAELAALAGPKTAFVFSVDLSHYRPYAEAVALDRPCLDALVRMDARDFTRCDTDGTQVLVVMEELAARLGATPRLLEYRNSGDVSGDRSRVVGYGALAFEEGVRLTADERRTLLALARASLTRAVKEGRPAEVPAEVAARFPRLRADGASFVTLKKGGQLRGCIGSLQARQPLGQDVALHALDAALRDGRFSPVTPAELPSIRLSISVLEAPRPLEASGSALLARLAETRPGIILEHQGRSSTFLPAVWEQLPDPVQFLAALCEKQGSPPTCWTRGEARFREYGAQEYEE